MISVLIVDDHEIVRAGVRTLLERHALYQVVGEAANGEEAITKALARPCTQFFLDTGLEQ
jgi:DNA-binding NarL/FixJ family response regulator